MNGPRRWEIIMGSNQAVRVAARLYEMRDGARTLLGDRFAARMTELSEPIKAVQERFGCNEIAAALRICQSIDDKNGFEVACIMAAAVEMVEPSTAATGDIKDD